MKKLTIPFLIFCLLLSLCGCGAADEESSPEKADPAACPDSSGLICFTDDLGTEFEISRPKRVVTMIGSFADVWCLAGGRDSLVASAADTWTSFDLDLRDDTLDIGTVKEPDLEIILASEPDLIIASCNTGANLKLKDSFEEMGINAAYFDVQRIDDYLNMLYICTRLTGMEENYKLYGEDVKAQAEAARAKIDGSSPEILCIRATGSGCRVKGSEGNLLGEMLSDMGCVNIADSSDSLLEELSLEVIMERDPEYIFVVLQGSNPEKAQKAFEEVLLSNPAWEKLTAVKEGRMFILEHELFNLKPNAKWGSSYEKLAEILYPEA